MTTKPLSGLAAITATAAIASLAVAGPADATTRTHTSLSIRSVSSVVNAGGHDRISGVLLAAGHALSGVDVTLAAKPSGAGSFSAVSHATTGSHGGVAFTVTPTTRTAYELVFAGTTADAPSHSGVVTVSVRPDRRLPTSLSIRLARSAINPGGSDTVSGVLLSHRTALGNRTVILQREVAGASTWDNAAHKRTGRHGFVAFTVKPGTRTHYRLIFRGASAYRPSHSGVVTVNVRTPASLSISSTATSIEPGASAVVSGVLSSSAGPAIGRPVALLAKPFGTSTWKKIASATTGNDGRVSFTVTPASSTRYVLVHQAGYAYTYARSAAVTILVRRPSSLSIRLSGSTVSGTLDGQGAGALAGRTVTLSSRPAGSSQAWTAVTSATTDDHGYVAFTVTPSSSTDYELSFAGGSAYDGCQSGVVTVTVS